MPTRGVFYGVVVVLVALLIVSGTSAAYYYGQYQQTSSQNQRYVGELNTALARYRSLSGSFNSSLQDYNETLTLLANAVANLNTSIPAYHEASVALSSLWRSYQSLATLSSRKAFVYEVDMLIDFGNGTRLWYNNTSVQPGWNGYVATLVLLDGNVQAVWYPQYGEHFVTGLDGIPDTDTNYWFLLTYNRTASWQAAQVGADELQMLNGTVFAWTYCSENANYLPACQLP